MSTIRERVEKLRGRYHHKMVYRDDVLALADEIDRERAQSVDVLKLALERHRQPSGEMCSCGGCSAVHAAIRLLKGDTT